MEATALDANHHGIATSVKLMTLGGFDCFGSKFFWKLIFAFSCLALYGVVSWTTGWIEPAPGAGPGPAGTGDLAPLRIEF
jgi:hypothetical protein